MKAFSSSILADTSYSSPEALKESYTSFKEMKDTRESMLVRLLEFNEAAAVADMESTRDFYIGLLKMCNDNKDPKLDAAYQAIFSKYDAVFTAAKTLNADDVCCPKCDSDCDRFEIRDKLKNISSAVNTTIPFICNVVSTPNPVYSEVYYGTLREYCKNGLDHLKNGSFNDWSYEPNIVSDICYAISTASGIKEASSIDEFITNYNDAFKYEPSDIAISVVNDSWYRAGGIIRNSKGYMCIAEISTYAMVDTLINAMKVNSDKLDINKVRAVVNTICDAISTYAILDAKMKDIVSKHYHYINDFNTKSIMKFLGTALGNNDISVRESMEIFGDEITSKSLFDDLDPEDFNRTEFLDLSLVAEHVMEMDKIQGRKYAIALEASLLAQGRYDELYKVNEALGQSIKNGVGKLIEAIRKMIAKFTETIMGNFATEKAYLTKYKNAILNSKVDPATPITFSGDVLAGMDRLRQGNFKIPTTSYNELMNSNNPNQFNSIDDFFKAHVADFGITGFNRNNNPDVKLADDLKVFWGYKQEGKEFKTTFGEINKRIADIYNFILETSKEAGRLRNESKNLDRTYKNYEASAKQYAGDRKPTGTTQATQATAQNASYFSAIYDKYILEGDTEIGQAPSANTQNTQQTNNNNGTVEQNKTNTKMTRGDTDKEVQGTKDDESKIVKNMEVYTKTCQAVIGARATGYEYVHKQLMTIIRYIVKNQFGNSADINYNNNNQQTQEQPQNNQNTAQNQTKSANNNGQPEGASNR